MELPDGNTTSQTTKKRSAISPFRRAILRGLGIIMPPLLTLVLLIWVWTALETYILQPIESAARYAIVLGILDTHEAPPSGAKQIDGKPLTTGFVWNSRQYTRAPSGVRYLPIEVKSYVDRRIDNLGINESPPQTANAYFHKYAQMRFLPRWLVIVVFLILFISILYVIGRAFAFGIGRVFVLSLERLVDRVPILRNIYSSVKQITDFLFGEREIEFTRVVAIEYPRRGIWTLGFVTGESMYEISAAANELVLSVLIPTSPMPMTGFTMTVRKSEALDLDISIDQALQYIVSCGVVVPPQQQIKFNRITQQTASPETTSNTESSSPARPPFSRSVNDGETNS